MGTINNDLEDYQYNSSSVSIAENNDDDDLYIYSSDFNCWIERNDTSLNDTTARDSTYCYYGHGVVITFSLLLVISMVLALVGNVMVILTIARHRGMRTRTNLLLANLAVADILVAVLDMPIALITIIKGDWLFSHLFCDFNGFTVGLGLMLSSHTLMWISIHKYISITKPFSRPVTPGKITMMILAAWIWAILFNLTPTSLIGLTDTEYKLGASQCGPAIPRSLKQYIHSALNTFVNLVTPFIVMAFCYYRIFKEVKDHLSRMRDFADVSACNSLIEQKRITETLCIVLSVFVLFWLPYIIYSLSLVFLGKAYVPVIFNPIAYLFGYMNSACNPIIYALRSASFRRGFSEIIFRNPRQRFTGSLYGQDQSTNRVGGMVVSIRRPLFGSDVHEKDEIHNQRHNNGKMSMLQQAKNDSSKKSLDNVLCDQTNPQGIDTKHGHEDQDNSGCKAIVYKDMKISINSKTSKDIKKYPESVSKEIVFYNLTKDASDPEFLEKKSGISNPLENKDKEKLLNIPEDGLNHGSSVNLDTVHYLNLESDGERKHHDSITPQTMKVVSNFCRTCASQPDITALPSQNLDIHIDGTRISNSQREILVTRLEIQDNQIRSVSVGDVRITCPGPRLEKCSPCPCAKVQDTKKVLPPHVSNLKYPFIWQPSVDNIYGSPIISRRNFPLRRKALQAKANETGNCDNCGSMHREKCCVSSVGNQKHLGVASLITSVKRSFTDLFHLDECTLNHSGAETLVSSEARAAGLSQVGAPDTSEGGATCLSLDKIADSNDGRAAEETLEK